MAINTIATASKYTDIDNNEKCNQARRNNYTSLGKLAALFVAVPFGSAVCHRAYYKADQRHNKRKYKTDDVYCRNRYQTRPSARRTAAVRQ